MHDSRGAALKVGDRVLIEAEVTELQSGDENFCCCAVKVVTPEQPNKEKVMQPPVFQAMSTKMLTKVGAMIVLFLFAPLTRADDLAEIKDRIANLEQRIDGVMTRMKADQDNMKAQLEEQAAQIVALKKPQAVWQPPKTGAWGETVQAGQWVSGATVTTTSVSAGACANGQCGVMRRLFRR